MRIVRPTGSAETVPVIQYQHGVGWVFGSSLIYDRLIRELAVGAVAALVFPDFSLSAEAKFPAAIEGSYEAARWIADHGGEAHLDSSGFAVAGDSVGGAMTSCWPSWRWNAVAPTSVSRCTSTRSPTLGSTPTRTASSRPVLSHDRRDEMVLGPVPLGDHSAPGFTAAGEQEQLASLPPALVINGEADVLRDEGEGRGRQRHRVVSGRYSKAAMLRVAHAAKVCGGRPRIRSTSGRCCGPSRPTATCWRRRTNTGGSDS
ncbi:alpha/beta hydrolase fold domain-containing protein [Rhodococcus opacus]|uniref:alpha/beta hydrolase fold domain-containing protein n=1 Tax=Rhodococcus opacus TaxID=37919 RepID=UPI00146A6495